MNNRLFLVLPLALGVTAGAFAEETAATGSDAAVEKLKTSLTNVNGFEVVDVRAGAEGASCITYTVTNDQNGISRSHAVVHNDKVLRETTGNTRFAKAWNSKCVNK